ncbi:hypothetical protein PCANC_28522 [Puccinia coronata f. sp. avenae]|uniref:Uncharacterized protein n=1 Tax=Puccinia coronata f. sp. avenae TaxID=200324 RepID=A0A2N5RXI4_9BASI|nr:hypothetical protein PCANC_28522 [Puccinia coronata f. sp. avenae]
MDRGILLASHLTLYFRVSLGSLLFLSFASGSPLSVSSSAHWSILTIIWLNQKVRLSPYRRLLTGQF